MGISKKDKKIVRHASLEYALSHINKHWKFQALKIHKGEYELHLKRKDLL